MILAEGILYQSVSFFSNTLKNNMNYSIYLPPKYNKDSRKYPVIYLLHGHNGNELSWIRKGHIDQTLDYMIKNYEIPPFIVVMPDAKNNWYVDSPSGQKYESAIINDLMNHIEMQYKVYTDRSNRFIAGLSMGGYGALKFAFKYPEKFMSAASLSGAIMREVPPAKDIDLEGNEINIHEDFYHDAFGWPFDAEFWEKENIFNFIDNVKKSDLELPIYLSCGNNDYFYLYLGACDLHHQLRLNKIPSQLYIRDGEHNWLLWKEEIKEVLKFFTEVIELY